FRVLDLPNAKDDAERGPARELGNYAAGIARQLERRVIPCEADARFGPDRWLGWLMPYVRARLKLALGLASPSDIPVVLIRHRARVFFPPPHRAVAFAFAELPVATGRAGLDRTRGWVPAAGRFITFHFE